MEVLECIKKRRSIRNYLEKPVVWDDIAHILEAGRYAPSAGNIQNWKFIVVLDKEKRSTIAEATKSQLWMETSPAYIVIIAEPVKSERYYGNRGKEFYTKQNCAAAAQNMLLEATNLGLGSCWVGAFDANKVKSILGIPEEAEPQIILTIGYPDEVIPEPTRFPLEVLTYFNSWRSKIRDVPAYFHYYSVHLNKGLKKGKETVEKTGKSIAEKTKQLVNRFRKE